jgi:type II secretory pathway pseudopilin PulG
MPLLNQTRLLKIGSNGDTIVEVLITLAAIGLAASLAFAIANTSLRSVRQASEHSEASVIAQSQVEGISSLSGSSTESSKLYSATQFCIETGSSSLNFDNLWTGSGNPPAGYSYCNDFDPTSLYKVSDYNCANITDPSSGPCAEVNRQDGQSPADLFVVQITWNDPYGNTDANGIDSTTLEYQVHQQ